MTWPYLDSGDKLVDDWRSESCRWMVIEGGHRISMEFGEYQVKKDTGIF